jgi:hypothetical protein
MLPLSTARMAKRQRSADWRGRRDKSFRNFPAESSSEGNVEGTPSFHSNDGLSANSGRARAVAANAANVMRQRGAVSCHRCAQCRSHNRSAGPAILPALTTESALGPGCSVCRSLMLRRGCILYRESDGEGSLRSAGVPAVSWADPAARLRPHRVCLRQPVTGSTRSCLSLTLMRFAHIGTCAR